MLVFKDGTRRILQGSDYYFRADGELDFIYGHSDVEPPDYYNNCIVLKGRWTDEANYARIVKEAMEWQL